MFAAQDPEAERIAQLHLGRMATVLAGSERQLTSMRELHDDQPAAGSLVARQLKEEPQISTPELSHPVLDAFAIATTNLLAAGDHLALLAKGIQPPPHPFGPATLARQAVELSGRAWYLLAPDIGAEHRSTRFVTELLYSLWEAEQHGAQMADGRSPNDVVEKLLGWVKATDHAVEKGRQGYWVVPEKRLPAHKIVKDMMGPVGSMGYGKYSAVAHGTVGGVSDILESEQIPGGPEGIGARIVVSVGDVALLVSWTLHGFLIALKRYFEVQGWRDAMTTEWHLHALQVAGDAGRATGLFEPGT
jgi:hypothetical protein